MQLLDRFNSISKDKMKKEKSSRTLEQYSISKNMYIAVWRLLLSAPRREMKPYREDIGSNGPTFLCYLFI